ncbi:hypothetical protein AB6A40_006481 [Gnathostoma spinigerum]|uniref:Ras-GAP domain-containing protein n=1 Tax=Gnathostoma spinigerum TaxID=75299 RepID=A0ABD6ESW6_9BILA
MESCSSNRHSDSLAILCERLRSEKLLVASEIENLQRLNEQVDVEQADLAYATWIVRQEQIILSRLVNSHPNVLPENSCFLISQLEATSLVEGYRRVDGQYYSSFTRLLNLLITSTRTVAELLNNSDSLTKEDGSSNDDFVSCVFSLLYGCCVFPNDERRVLETLSHLMDIQVASNVDPRLILRRGNSAFCRLYRLFADGLYTAKIFLTAALHDSVMFLLSQDELFLDIDPSKSAIRFPPEERRRRFGEDENSLSYLQRLTAHRKIIESKLISIGNRFINGITQAMTCFPQSLSWLVRQLRNVLMERKKVGSEQACLICTDLIFTYLICPAITNPETLGVISDTPVSYIARFNLMQVGQILQTLALSPFEQPQSQLAYFYSKFDQHAVAEIVQTVVSSTCDSLDVMFPVIVSDSQKLDREQFFRRSFVGSLTEVNCLLSNVRSSVSDNISDQNLQREITSLIERLPNRFEYSHSPESSKKNVGGLNKSPSQRNRTMSPNFGRDKLKSFADKVQTVTQHKLRQQPSVASDSRYLSRSSSDRSFETSVLEILRFPFGENREPMGLKSEEKFMEELKQAVNSRKQHKSNEHRSEKRTRFVDTESIGLSDRTTDAGSYDEEEAASLSSSIEENADNIDDVEDISTLPDNFSDVLPSSANVSGRGSPSVSGPPSLCGRETPQSVRADNHSGNPADVTLSNAPNNLRGPCDIPVTVRRENPEGLEDKFGKFGLPPQENRHRYRMLNIIQFAFNA